VALTHRAYLFNDMGDAQRAVRDFDAALAASEPGSVQARHVHWSRGWARYDTGDVNGALADWNESARLHGGKPYWLPYTSALGYWTLGDAESALRWFGIAAASRPEWVTDEGVREKTRYWSKQQQAGMWGLYQAWKAGPARSSPPLQP
jgi:tetratricopeptide (TPR) repeat protein